MLGTIVATLLGVAVFQSAPGAAAREPVRRITLEEALSLFAGHNLELRVARAEAAGDVARARQPAAFPNPALGLTHESLGGDGRSAGETYLTLTQELRWPWEVAARGAAAAAQRAASGHRVTHDSLRLAFTVRRAFLEAAAAEQVRDDLARATVVVRATLDDAAQRAAAGDLSGYALRRLRVERARYEADLSAAEIALDASRRRLSALLLPDSAVRLAPSGLPSAPPPEVSAESVRSIASLAVVAEAEGTLAAARAAERGVRSGRLPAPTIVGGYKSQRDGLAGAFLGVSLPLPVFDRQSAATARAAAVTAAAEARLALVSRDAQDDVALTAAVYQAARERAALMRDELLVEPEALLDVARVAYAEGEMNLVELLDAIDAFRAARAAAAAAQRDVWVAYFDVERAVGGLPTGSEGER